jgi:sterol desaturase/sphingolipid hydroxylase (fatty acid hydroxylase superfamily)
MEKYQSIRIFKNPILEFCTHVHPLTPLLLWCPYIAYLFYRAYAYVQLTTLEFVSWFFIGIVIWSLTEYLMHRYVFHFPAKNRFTKRFVYLFHGLHHDDANDPTRLVMPPVPAILLVFLLTQVFSILIPGRYLDVFMGYFLIGYLCYDYIHYATHHFAMTSKVGKYLRTYHLKHHFSREHSKYGVSSPLWDYIFSTVTGPKKESAEL